MGHFFAYLSRMKLITRWCLMQNIRSENVQEHSLQVAVVGHALAVISKRYYDRPYNAERVALLSLFHDASEVFTGDMPTPAKYFSPEIRDAYKRMEGEACQKLLSFLPQELRADYQELLIPNANDEEVLKLIKAADSICAYLKCLEELAAGNREFNQAKLTLESKIKSYEMPEVDHFMKHFAPSFSLTLDELSL